MRLTAALSDGHRLFAIRYSSDVEVPTLYHRRACSTGGRALVSEPLEDGEDGWTAIPPGSWAEIGVEGAAISPFCPAHAALAA